MAENKDELKDLLMKVKELELKRWLKTQHSKNKDHGIWSHHFMATRWRNDGNSDTLFSWAPKSLQMLTASMIKRTDSLEKTLMLGKIKGRRRWGQ